MGHWCCVWDLPDASVCVHWYSTVIALALALGQLHRVLCVHSALLDCTSYVQHTDQELQAWYAAVRYLRATEPPATTAATP